MNTEASVLAAGSPDLALAIVADSEAKVSMCYQCAKCTSGCPVAARTDLRPHELVRLVQLGARDEALGSRMLWECTSCETCVTRCPHGVDIPAMMDSLRRMARSEKKTVGTTKVPVFNDIFLRVVRRRGRTYEAGLMASFKLRTLRLFEDMGKLPMMLWKRKLAILPPSVPGGAERKRLFERAATKEGEAKAKGPAR
jgi:heterodisulfide reductase subunit C